VPKLGEPYPMTLLPLLVGGKSIVSVLEGDSVPDVFIPQLAQWVLTGDMPIGKLTTNYRFEDVAIALDDAHAGRVIKPVLRMA
jgi:aryl-alcohol dehydrogenase